MHLRKATFPTFIASASADQKKGRKGRDSDQSCVSNERRRSLVVVRFVVREGAEGVGLSKLFHLWKLRTEEPPL